MVEGNNDKLTAPTLALAETQPGNLEEEGYEGDPRCQKCDTVVSADDIVVKHVTKGVQKKVLCKSCHAVQTMMARSFEEMPAGWDDLSHEDSVEFYKTMLQKKAEGPLRFQVLRAEMKAVLINRTLQETKKGFNGEFQPLSFWSQRGYDTQRIQEKAEKMDLDVLGPTYRVDIFHVSSETIKQRVEEALLKALKAQREPAKDSKVVTGLASKTLTTMQPVLERMSKAEKGLKTEDIDKVVLDSFKEKKALAEKLVEQAQRILKTVGSGGIAAKDSLEMDSDKAVSTEIKSMNQVLKSLNLAKKSVSSKD
eukprot:g19386.t1